MSYTLAAITFLAGLLAGLLIRRTARAGPRPAPRCRLCRGRGHVPVKADRHGVPILNSRGEVMSVNTFCGACADRYPRGIGV